MFERSPLGRIEWFGRLLVIYLLAATAGVMATMTVSNLSHIELITLLTPNRLDRQHLCNNLLGARTLFWAVCLADLATVIAIVVLRRAKGEMAIFRAQAEKLLFPDQKIRNDFPRIKFGLVVLFLISYWGSYHLAYVNQELCVDKPLMLAGLDYVYLGAVNLCHGLCLMLAYLLYFQRMDTQSASGSDS